MKSEDLYSNWIKKRLFSFENDNFKTRKFIHTSFLSMSQQSIFVSSLRKYFYFDTCARYLRSSGCNVLQGFGFNDMSYNYLKGHKLSRMRKNFDYLEIESQKSVLKNLGVCYDLNKEIKTNSLEYISFVQKVFLQLLKHKLITYEKLNCQYSISNKRIYNTFEISDLSNYTNQSLDVLSLDISKYIPRIIIQIERLDIKEEYKQALLNAFEEKDIYYLLLNSFDNEVEIEVPLLYPEYIGGIDFICLNPSKIDVEKYCSYDELEYINKYIQTPIGQAVFSGTVLRSPLDNKEIPVIISYHYNEGIHVGIPSIDENDFSFASKLDLLISDVVEDDIIINSDFLSGLTIQTAKNKIVSLFLEEELLTLKKEYNLKKIIISQLDHFGVLAPLKLDPFSNKIIPIDSKSLVFLHNNKRVCQLDNVITEEQDIFEGSLNSLFSEGLSSLFIKYYDSKYTLDFPFEVIDKVDDLACLFINKNQLFTEILMPIIFNEIFLDIYQTNYLGSIKKVIVLNDQDENTIPLDSIVLLEDILSKYSNDVLRLYLTYINIEERPTVCFSTIDVFKNYLISLEKMYKSGFCERSRISPTFNKLKVLCNKYMSILDFEHVISLLMTYHHEILTLNQMTKKEALEYLVMLSMFVPYFAERIYLEYFDKEGSISYISYPTD